MKRILFLLSVVLLTSCSDNDSDLQNADYSSIYDELVMEHTSLDSLSGLTNVPKESLVKMRFCMIEEDSDLTDKLKEILIACRHKDGNRLNSIKEDKESFEVVNHGNREISMDAYNGIIVERNQKFGERLPDIISDYVSEEVDGFIESKYSLFTAIPNTWNYYTKSDEDFTKDFLADLNTSNLGSKCESYYVQRVNNYKNVICEESEIMGDKLSIPDFGIIPGDSSIEIESTLKDLIKERTKSQIEEISSDILWDVIIALAVGFIISLMLDAAIEDAKSEAINKFLRSVRWKKDDGFFLNLGRAALHAVGAYGEYEDQVNAIKARYNTWKWIANICVFIISFVVAWFFFIIPQLRMEGDINAELTTKIIESSNTLNMKPENVLNRYMNVGGSDEVDEIDVIPDENTIVGVDTVAPKDDILDVSES